MRQHLLIDADDTLWENNIYFEQAFEEFCAFLDHSTLSPPEIRAALDEIEIVNIRAHGYGAANFGRNMAQCYLNLAERPVRGGDTAHIAAIARRINHHPLQIIDGVPETLHYLSHRHDLILLTKGDRHEQSAKIEKSGLAVFFRQTVIVREKDPDAYRGVVLEQELAGEASWMIGNSPKSDINPAIEAGIGAVYVPHPRTWRLEHEEIREGDRLLIIERFQDLSKFF
ncbi:MAG: HAD family hydrolase [Bryobacterales bacterium]|nr:HAD family hydrolase [Bryobacterales bacterium]